VARLKRLRCRRRQEQAKMPFGIDLPDIPDMPSMPGTDLLSKKKDPKGDALDKDGAALTNAIKFCATNGD